MNYVSHEKKKKENNHGRNSTRWMDDRTDLAFAQRR
jgi:hypothetical protein